MSSELIQDRAGYTVRRTFVSEMNNAVYVLTAKGSGDQILIDAADDIAALRALLADGAADAEREASGGATEPGQPGSGAGAGSSAPTPESAPPPAEAGSRLAWILITHAHWDHTRAVAALAAETGARIVIGHDDNAQLEQERGVGGDLLLSGGERISIDDISLEAIHLRGHTPGSMAFASTDEAPVLLFTGDSLFPGGVGNTGDEPARFEQLFSDVSERLFDRFGDDAVVYPGHGAETTLGAERPSLPDWRARGW